MKRFSVKWWECYVQVAGSMSKNPQLPQVRTRIHDIICIYEEGIVVKWLRQGTFDLRLYRFKSWPDQYIVTIRKALYLHCLSLPRCRNKDLVVTYIYSCVPLFVVTPYGNSPGLHVDLAHHSALGVTVWTVHTLMCDKLPMVNCCQVVWDTLPWFKTVKS